MALLDFILNLAALLLWLNWRLLALAPRESGPSGISLAGTIKSTAASRSPRWPYLSGLGGLLLVRSLAYHTIGSNLAERMTLPFGIVSISFNPRILKQMFLFSGLSFGLFLGAFYLWLLLFSIVNTRVTEPNACLRLLRLHLGWWERRPVWLKLLLPGVLGALAWLIAASLLEALALFPAQSSNTARGLRACLVGLYTYLCWVPPLASVLVLYMVNSYVYLGESAFWGFVQVTGRNLIEQVGLAKLRLRRLDFAPLLLLALVWFLQWRGHLGWFFGGARLLVEGWNRLR